MAKRLIWVALLVAFAIIDVCMYVDGGSGWCLVAAAALFFVAGVELGAAPWGRGEVED